MKRGPRPLDRLIAFENNYTPEPNSGCWLWTGALTEDGYGRFNDTRAHRLSWTLFRGARTPERIVCHRCDVPLCVNPEHLFVGTHADNVHDMCSKGRNRSSVGNGEQNGAAKLTGADIVAIRSMSGSATPIATLFDVTPEQINNIRSYRAWRHLQ